MGVVPLASSESPSQSSTNPGKAWLNGATLGDVKPCDEPDGWPEFEITVNFYVSSDDPAVIERERRRVFEALPDAVMEVTDA